MLADIGAGRWERVVLPDQAHRIGAAPLVDQSDIAGDIHPRRAQGHAGHRILQISQTAVVLDVLNVVVPEALQSLEHQSGSVVADGTGGGAFDGPRGLLQHLQVLHLPSPLQDLSHQGGELSQADAAGHALPAGLGVAEVQKIAGHVDGAEPRRRGCDPPLHVVVELVHHHLGPVRRLDIQSAQIRSPSFFFSTFIIIKFLCKNFQFSSVFQE